LQKVRQLVNQFQVNAYVCKGRNGLVELSKAITAVDDDLLFLSPQIEQALQPKNNLEIEDYDIELLKCLALGHPKEAISELFKNKGISASSLSSIEKRQSKLCIQFSANNAAHLIGIVKDLGLI
jgi:hypothetical protein